MWAQQERFADMARFRDAALAFGYEAVEVSHSTAEPGLRELLRGGAPRGSSLHAPTPYRRLDDGRHNGDANLASDDETQRRLAIAETKRTVDFAAEAGVGYVVVHLGGVGDRRDAREEALRGLFEAGKREGPAWEAARAELRDWRSANAPRFYEAARRSLEELVDYASARGVALGLESRLNYHEFPHPEEALSLLAPYENGVAGFWLDVGHCEVQSRLGMIDWRAWLPRLSPRILGCHLHDVRGILDHRYPGNGTLDWGFVASVLPADAVRVLEIDQREPEAGVAAASAFLREKGVV